MRSRPIRNLYFAYIRGTDIDGIIGSDEACAALCEARLIEVTAYGLDGRPSHYAETARMKAVREWPGDIIKILKQSTEKKAKEA